MPQSIQEYILQKCKDGKGKVTLQDPVTHVFIGGLEFDNDGFSKTIDEKVYIVGYIERLLTFSRSDVIILVDNEALDQMSPKLLTGTVAE